MAGSYLRWKEDMIGYVGTLVDNPRSVEVANRCIRTGVKFNVNVSIFSATSKKKSRRELESIGLSVSKFDESYSVSEAVLGNFVTQFRIWKKIIEIDKPAIVLEHDAVFVRPVPDLTDKGVVINIAKPSFGRFDKKKNPGIYPFFSKKGGYFGGAHGYYVTPVGAVKLIQTAKKIGAGPCDLFLCRKNFPDLKEIYPWPIEAHDGFSTIQHRKGCIAKHRFDKNYLSEEELNEQS